MLPPPPIDYIADSAVDAALDLALRELLSACFTKPQDHVFKTRRYFNEPPAHRWLIRDATGTPVAHLAAHEKQLFTDDGRTLRIGGIAEVCVRPDHQGRGYVKPLIAAAHRRMGAGGFAFSVLSGNERYYASSGYRPVNNLLRDGVGPAGEAVRIRAEGFLAAPLSDTVWPHGDVYIPGPSF
ncbi:aminoglycoside 2'-N-acetyltransferase [Opitutaceae bacterium TAV5]|nr:aminoglycoside 2'-N-acetyltransferase [Opitutaceae bacterium TAV5]